MYSTTTRILYNNPTPQPVRAGNLWPTDQECQINYRLSVKKIKYNSMQTRYVKGQPQLKACIIEFDRIGLCTAKNSSRKRKVPSLTPWIGANYIDSACWNFERAAIRSGVLFGSLYDRPRTENKGYQGSENRGNLMTERSTRIGSAFRIPKWFRSRLSLCTTVFLHSTWCENSWARLRKLTAART